MNDGLDARSGGLVFVDKTCALCGERLLMGSQRPILLLESLARED